MSPFSGLGASGGGEYAVPTIRHGTLKASRGFWDARVAGAQGVFTDVPGMLRVKNTVHCKYSV